MTRRALLQFDWAAARRGRLVPLFAAGFAVASVGVALAGLSAGGAVVVQGFARTSISLLQLTLWTVPLLALLLGAVSGAECTELEFLTALPLPRAHIVISRWAAWTVALSAALVTGFGAAGLVIGVFAGSADVGRYVALIGVAALLVSAGLAVGMWIGIGARSRARAVGFAVVVWFVLVVGADLAAIALLSILPAHTATWSLVVLLTANPVDSARALGLGLFQADAVAGPTGAALHRLLGGPGAMLMLVSLIAWTIVPLRLAGRRFASQDL
ncbi:MAG TPA: ABC transporter permease subunit [Gemmatimonadales bacterium]|nr:ABC transporter permease subunit [Gemmatimonadales bacterium]